MVEGQRGGSDHKVPGQSHGGFRQRAGFKGTGVAGAGPPVAVV